MGATYTRQSTFTDGDVITANLFNNEFDQLLAAFAVNTGHTHDGTAGEGGPISLVASDNVTIGTGAGDITLTWDGGSNNGAIIWSEDEDYFTFSDDILLATSEKLQFRDTAIYIHSSADGQLDLVADTEIQIAATTIDMNGILDVSGNLLVGGNLTVAGDATVTGTTTFNGGTITLGDAVTDNVVFGADVNSSIIPNGVAGSFDLGSSGQEWRDIFINGTAHIDTLDVDENATVTGTLGVTGVLTGTSLDISGNVDIDGVTNLDVVDIDGAVNIAAATTIDAANKIQFRDTGLFINSSADGQLDIVADTEIQIAATTVDINGAVDVSGNLVVGGDLTITGDDLVMGTNTAGMLLIADGTNFNPTAVGDLSEIATVASDDVFLAIDTSGGGLKRITRSAVVSGLATSSAISNVVEDTTPQLGGNLDVLARTITTSTSNGNIAITPNGSGVVLIDGFVGIEAGLIDLKNSGSAVSQIKFYCESSNAHAQTLIGAPHAESGSNTLTLPSSGGNSRLLSAASTATLTNKTLTAPKIVDAGFIADANGNEQLIFQTTGSAVNQFEMTNSASSTAFLQGPILEATGGDSNIDLNLLAKGTGVVAVRGNTNSGAIQFNCESNSHGQILIGQPHSASVTNTMLLPAGANSTLVSLVSTDTLTNKTLTSPKINEDVAVTSTATEINLLDGVTSTTAELNILDGVTSTAAELNALDGITAVVGELNALDIGSTAVGTAVASKAVILDSNKDYTGIRNFTITGELDAATLDISGAVDIDGNVDINGTLLQTGVATFTAIPIANAGISVKNGATGAGFVSFFEDSDNGDNSVKLIGPASTADVTLTLPAVTGTLITSASAIDEATALAIALG